MNPKDKAIKLIKKHLIAISEETMDSNNIINYNAKQCALITVDEILELNVCWYDEDLVKSYPKSYKPSQTIEFWEQVKIEIQNYND